MPSRKKRAENIDLLENWPDILEVKDITQALKISRHSVYKLLDQGSLRGFRIGKIHKVTKKSLIGYINQLCSQNEK